MIWKRMFGIYQILIKKNNLTSFITHTACLIEIYTNIFYKILEIKCW